MNDYSRMSVGGGTLLSEAQEWVLANVDNGVVCPCCDQIAKIYKRKMTNSMAYALILIRKFFMYSDEEWLHVPSYLNGRGVVARGGDWAKLRYWGLIVSKGDVRPDKSRRTGMWKITQWGVDFVDGRMTVPKFVFVYDEKPLSQEGRITIQEALSNKFNYEELMSGR